MSNNTCDDGMNPRPNENEFIKRQPLLQIRDTIKSSLIPLVLERDKDADLDYLIKTTQALVTTNEEIWERCKSYIRCEELGPGKVSGDRLPFYRFGFKKVHVKTSPDTSPQWLRFSTRCTVQLKKFAMTPLPQELRKVILAPLREEVGLVKYREYLHTCFLLEETVLVSFLAIFKDHLEMLQVDLGNVETWIMGSIRSNAFLQETFSTVPEIKTQKKYQKTTCNYCCIRCGYFFENHEFNK